MKKLLLVLIAIILIIPIIIAVLSYKNKKQEPPTVTTVSSVSLTVLSGKSYQFVAEKGEEDAAMIQTFVDLTNSASKVSQLPVQLDGRHYVVNFSSKGNAAFNFYFTTNPEVCYYTDDTSIYKLNADDAKKFLNTKYAADLYDSSRLPVLSLSGNVITPATINWNFQTIDGSFAALDTTGLTTAQIKSYELSGGLGFSFSTIPDYCTVTVADAATGAEIFQGPSSQISSINLGGRGPVSVRLNATWGQGLGRAWHGETEYLFLANISAPADFFLKCSDSNQAGDVMTITAYNVDNVNDISFSSSIDLGSPRFFAVSSDNYAVAIVPIPLNAPVGAATITLTYNGISKVLDFKVAKRTTKASDLTVKAAVYNSYYTQSVMSTYSETISPYLAYAASTQYWDGAFKKLFDDSAIKCGYGRTRNILSGTKATGVSFVQESIVYKAAANKKVTATAAGEVIYAGYLEFCGNIVIIEHGYGLKSWYMHMDSISVSAGDVVQAGAEIGVVGQTGFCASDYSQVEFAMSVFDQFFCPYDLWSDGEYKGLDFPTN